MLEIHKEKALKPFGITPARKLTNEELDRAREVNAVFDALKDRAEIGERALFDLAYPDTAQADAAMLHFLHQVIECPQIVLDLAELKTKQAHEQELQRMGGVTPAA